MYLISAQQSDAKHFHEVEFVRYDGRSDFEDLQGHSKDWPEFERCKLNECAVLIWGLFLGHSNVAKINPALLLTPGDNKVPTTFLPFTTLQLVIKEFNPARIIIRLPRKKWGENWLRDDPQRSTRREHILSVLACANSMYFENALSFAQKGVDLCRKSLAESDVFLSLV